MLQRKNGKLTTTITAEEWAEELERRKQFEEKIEMERKRRIDSLCENLLMTNLPDELKNSLLAEQKKRKEQKKNEEFHKRNKGATSSYAGFNNFREYARAFSNAVGKNNKGNQ